MYSVACSWISQIRKTLKLKVENGIGRGQVQAMMALQLHIFSVRIHFVPHRVVPRFSKLPVILRRPPYTVTFGCEIHSLNTVSWCGAVNLVKGRLCPCQHLVPLGRHAKICWVISSVFNDLAASECWIRSVRYVWTCKQLRLFLNQNSREASGETVIWLDTNLPARRYCLPISKWTPQAASVEGELIFEGNASSLIGLWT